MKDHDAYLSLILRQSEQAGSHETLCGCRESQLQEITYRSGELNLLRSVRDEETWVRSHISKAKGAASGSGIDSAKAQNIVSDAVEIALTSEPDQANALAPRSDAGRFSRGPLECDMDAMSERFVEFLDECRTRYPKVHIETSTIHHENTAASLQNSNGVDFRQEQGMYQFGVLVANQENKKSGSFNYAGVLLGDLDEPLIESGSIKGILENENNIGETADVDESFIGSLIITPDCLMNFIDDLVWHLSNYPLISGTSILRDSLGSAVASPAFSLSSLPKSDELVVGSGFSKDGFPQENLRIIDKGDLRSFLLDLYGSLKTGKERGRSSGDFYVVDPGDSSFEALIAGVDKGILLTRFSGSTAPSGDFSGVAKNSNLISKGQIKGRVEETMVSGNLLDLFKNIDGISEKRINFGDCIMPWIRSGGITVSPA